MEVQEGGLKLRVIGETIHLPSLTPLPRLAQCPAGQFNIKTGQQNCTDCAEGKLSSNDRSACGDCPAGTYVSEKKSCEACEAGTYAPSAIDDDCIDCLEGFHTGVALGASTCSSCNAGTYSVGKQVT